MFDIYFYWLNRPGFTRKVADSLEGAIAIAKVRAFNMPSLMSVNIVDGDYNSRLISREELLKRDGE